MSSDVGRPLILSLGGINMDLVTFADRLPADGETVVGSRFVTYAGGKGANQAVAVARMSARSAMVGRVGDDMFGPQLIELLQSAGVETGAVGISQGVSSGIAVISVGEGGQNRIVQVLGANDTCGDVEFEAIAGLLAEASAVLLQLEVSVDLSLRVAALAAIPGSYRDSGSRPGATCAGGILPARHTHHPQRNGSRGAGGPSRRRSQRCGGSGGRATEPGRRHHSGSNWGRWARTGRMGKAVDTSRHSP